MKSLFGAVVALVVIVLFLRFKLWCFEHGSTRELGDGGIQRLFDKDPK
jgi:hypothetical protein